MDRGDAMLYTLTYTTDLPPNSNGCARFLMIRIHPDKREDEGLLCHEREHVRQFWTGGLIVHSLLYALCKWYRLRCEAEACRVQLQYPPASLNQDRYRDMYAGWLAAPGWTEGYDLQNICTKEQALKLLA